MSATKRAVVALSLALSCHASVAYAQSKEACASDAEDAQSRRQKGELVEARERLVRCSQNACPAFIRKDCIRWLGELDTDLPNLAVRVNDWQGNVVIKAEVLIDGTSISPTVDAKSRAINPGNHHVVVKPEEGVEESAEVAIASGERRVVVVKLRKPVLVPPPPPTATATTTVTPPSPPPPRPIPTGTFIAGGIAVAALAGFTVIEIIAQGDVSDLRDGCGQTKTCSHDDVSSAKTKLDVAAVLLGVGVVAAATGVVFYFMSPPGADTKKAYLPFRNGKFYF